jgi:hypothetical protein
MDSDVEIDAAGNAEGQQQQRQRPMSGGEAGTSGGAGRGGRQQQQQQQQAAADMGPRPDRRGDYRTWVAWQKQKWRQVRQERKRRKVEAAKRPAAAEQGPAAVSG